MMTLYSPFPGRPTGFRSMLAAPGEVSGPGSRSSHFWPWLSSICTVCLTLASDSSSVGLKTVGISKLPLLPGHCRYQHN